MFNANEYLWMNLIFIINYRVGQVVIINIQMKNKINYIEID